MYPQNVNIVSGGQHLQPTIYGSNAPATIDHQTGQLINVQNNTRKMPAINPAYKIGKAGEELKIILNNIFNQGHDFNIWLRISNLGTRYVIMGYETIFFDGNDFKEKLKNHSISKLGLLNLSGKSIQNVITVLKETPEYWHRDPPFHNSPKLRIFNNGDGRICYFPNNQAKINLTQVSPLEPVYPIGLLVSTSSIAFDHQYLLRALDYHSLNNVKLNPKNSINSLLNFFTLIGMPNNKTMVITWLIYSLISQQFILLELINPKTNAHLSVLDYLKSLIDPSSENIQTIPKKADDIYRIGLEHYVIGLNASSQTSLSTEQQSALLELSFNNGAKIEAIKSKNTNSKIFVKRPIIIGAQDTLITEPNLRKKTISLSIPSPEGNAGGLPSNHQIDSARLELLQLTTLSSHVVSYENITNNQYFEHNRFKNFETYIHLGCEVSHLLNQDNGQNFINEFEAWALEDIFVQMDENDIAYVIYTWAEEHKSSTNKHSIKDWIYELSHYAESEGIDIRGLSPRKIGAEFKQAVPILEKLGIKIESSGRSRMSEWTITVMDKIDLKGSIILNPRSI